MRITTFLIMLFLEVTRGIHIKYLIQCLDHDKGYNNYYHYFWPWEKGIPEKFGSALVNFTAIYPQISKGGWSHNEPLTQDNTAVSISCLPCQSFPTLISYLQILRCSVPILIFSD